VLSFTAEEAWQSLPEPLRGDAASVFDLELRDGDPADPAVGRWQQLRDLRARVAASQSPRDFEAKVRLGAPARSFDWLASLGDNLREALVVSEVDLFRTGDDAETVELLAASGEKCARCWKFRQLGSDPANPLVCSDCAGVLSHLDL
jgi:isoleucyl-tRNA synthetase